LDIKIILLAIIIGEIFIRDTISEHYCIKIFRENINKIEDD